MEFLNLGIGEILVLALVVFIVLGPEKAVDAGRGLGRFIGQLRRSEFWQDARQVSEQVDQVIQTAINDTGVPEITQEIRGIRQEVRSVIPQIAPPGGQPAVPAEPAAAAETPAPAARGQAPAARGQAPAAQGQAKHEVKANLGDHKFEKVSHRKDEPF
ncbi:MAG TPA: twin-arginine translocase TatA/TatE family subunit [Anaerolineaceae bacterium]|nr:twin-arginine translocase TatA/TatE family subunit [Anaerolineaceae bacterium]HPN52056.1 twin-arginine translocase TatA/TatE family subunit [Anaerolineaceae bacterium]